MTQAPDKPKLDRSTISPNLPQISASSKPIPQKNPLPIVSWFYNISIRKKQVFVLVTAQAISIVALLSVGIIQVVQGGREQLVNQSISELEATKINYSIKVNQMGFGFRGQSDNLAIINAALINVNGGNLNPQERSIVRRILQNEIKARNIEYATLVGRDQRIIVNANNERTGQEFNPNGLVSQVINNPQQIKTTEITPWTDLAKELPPIFPSLSQNQDVLTRYTFTPVFRPGTQQVIGVLVSGDVVDGKFSIVEDTIREFKGGYSAIYKITGDKKFSLSSALTETDTARGQSLTTETLLKLALENPDDIVSVRDQVGENTYTFTAQIIPNFQKQPVGILVRGTPETALNKIISGNLSVQGQTAVAVLILNLLLILILGRVIAKPIESLQLTAELFAEGDYTRRTDIQGNDEIGKLARTFNYLADNIAQTESILMLDSSKISLFQEITGSRTLDEDDLNSVFDRALPKAKEILQVDRLVIYRFKPDWSGYISNEAGDFDLPSALSEEINDPCIPPELRNAYLNGRVVPTENVYTAGFAEEHEALMYRLQIKSNLVVPIISQGQLFALLIAHHCRQHHTWEEREITFLGQIALRFGVILDRVNILKNQMAAANRAEQLKEITLSLASSLTRTQVLDSAVKEIRTALKTDRTIVYEFDETWRGTIIAESVALNFPSALGATVADPCFADRYVEQYQQGRVQATSDIYRAGLTQCHIKQLEPFAVKANLVAPILVNRKLIGLLICHQCSGVRNWEVMEIELFTQLATQVGLSLERVKLLELQLNAEIIQREGKELLQRRALELLMQVDPVSQGDLTIRATVTEDEIGTIADSYNATIESLRKIVSEVQTAAAEVAKTTTTNENDVRILRQEIEEQVGNISEALQTINQMSRSSNLVAENAEQAEEALQKAQESVEIGDSAMNRTVKSIIEIRSTVQQAAEQVKKLGDTTQNISTVVGLIGRFAAQTHLLALKASIEAARAGEQGTGFAVIAEEVRTLATQSAQATADIDKLVNEIINETKVVVTAMEEGTEQVIEGSKLVEETRQSLNQIAAATTQINELVEAIAAAAFEQSENSEDVKSKMSEVAKVAEKTTASVIQLSDSFVELQEVARKLESNVSQFKVS
ncbi:methyl-accepting chemotaxis protein [Geminocystis sp. NIES-3709]|uniref:methyl-accepting chemotaxis protein n=1 Tax=Geminocystis sp. NIES-3709 TaxID=1617448 RepID=UPI0005FCD3E3|nr:methyl-accepting chemotaxis protein [Geminocystis sp. NIES-3709]BAQ65297.1 methyl accepting chemotaxis protein [Geminocystis sp. NIES-3709]